jgi:hypothetical protein
MAIFSHEDRAPALAPSLPIFAGRTVGSEAVQSTPADPLRSKLLACRGACLYPASLVVQTARAPVAQLDRALPSEGRGREFESRRVRQLLHRYQDITGRIAGMAPPSCVFGSPTEERRQISPWLRRGHVFDIVKQSATAVVQCPLDNGRDGGLQNSVGGLLVG